MSEHHKHEAVLERIGIATIKEHLGISRQVIFNWKRRGVPRNMHKALVLLAETQGVDGISFN
jgi:hypothetical protein